MEVIWNIKVLQALQAFYIRWKYLQLLKVQSELRGNARCKTNTPGQHQIMIPLALIMEVQMTNS